MQESLQAEPGTYREPLSVKFSMRTFLLSCFLVDTYSCVMYIPSILPPKSEFLSSVETLS